MAGRVDNRPPPRQTRTASVRRKSLWELFGRMGRTIVLGAPGFRPMATAHCHYLDPYVMRFGHPNSCPEVSEVRTLATSYELTPLTSELEVTMTKQWAR